MSETTPLIKAALNLRVGVGFDVYAAAVLHAESGITIDIYNDASADFFRNLIGAASHAE